MPEKIHLKKFLIFCLITRIWGTLSAAMQNPEAPKGVCQCHCIKHEITPGHQAPVRPPPQPGSRKFRSSYCSEAEQKKEKVSPPGVRLILIYRFLPRRPANLYFSAYDTSASIFQHTPESAILFFPFPWYTYD